MLVCITDPQIMEKLELGGTLAILNRDVSCYTCSPDSRCVSARSDLIKVPDRVGLRDRTSLVFSQNLKDLCLPQLPTVHL